MSYASHRISGKNINPPISRPTFVERGSAPFTKRGLGAFGATSGMQPYKVLCFWLRVQPAVTRGGRNITWRRPNMLSSTEARDIPPRPSPPRPSSTYSTSRTVSDPQSRSTRPKTVGFVRPLTRLSVQVIEPRGCRNKRTRGIPEPCRDRLPIVRQCRQRICMMLTLVYDE